MLILTTFLVYGIIAPRVWQARTGEDLSVRFLSWPSGNVRRVQASRLRLPLKIHEPSCRSRSLMLDATKQLVELSWHTRGRVGTGAITNLLSFRLELHQFVPLPLWLSSCYQSSSMCCFSPMPHSDPMVRRPLYQRQSTLSGCTTHATKQATNSPRPSRTSHKPSFLTAPFLWILGGQHPSLLIR